MGVLKEGENMATLRIYNISTENTSPQDGQYLAIDGASALAKINYSTLKEDVTSDLNTSVSALTETTDNITDLLAPFTHFQQGTESFASLAANSQTSITVTFDEPFEAEPRILLTQKGGNQSGAGYLNVGYYNSGANGFSICVRNLGSSSYNGRVSWLAFL